MLRYSKSAAVLAVIAFLAAGCSKSSSPTSSNNTPPKLTTPTFTGPNTKSDSAGAIEAGNFIAGVNFYAALAEGYLAGNPTQNGNTWTGTATQGQLTITWTATALSDTGYTWKVVFNGPTDSVTYNNWTFLQGTTSSDGKYGSFTLYQPNTTKILSLFSWSTDASGNVPVDIKQYSTDGVTLVEEIKITDNADKSGEMDLYTGTVLTFKATWTSTGSGQWWDYDPSTGTQTYHGVWS